MHILYTMYALFYSPMGIEHPICVFGAFRRFLSGVPLLLISLLGVALLGRRAPEARGPLLGPVQMA
jgi:hypothetical protein